MNNSNISNTRVNSVPNSSKYLEGGMSMENIEALNGMYDQIEAEELAYYSALFPEEEGDEKPSEEVEMILSSITRDEDHYRLLKEVHERTRGLSS